MTNFEALKNAESEKEAAIIIEDFLMDFHMEHGDIDMKEWLRREKSSIQEMRIKMLFALTKTMGEAEDET